MVTSSEFPATNPGAVGRAALTSDILPGAMEELPMLDTNFRPQAINYFLVRVCSSTTTLENIMEVPHETKFLEALESYLGGELPTLAAAAQLADMKSSTFVHRLHS